MSKLQTPWLFIRLSNVVPLFIIAFMLVGCDITVNNSPQVCAGGNVNCTKTNGGNTPPQGTVAPQTSPTQGFIPTVAPTSQVPTAQCKGYVPTGKQQTIPLQGIIVPNSCILILDGYSGTVGGVNWTNGGVIALGPDTYNGQLTDGEWLIVSASIGASKFCEKVRQLQNNGQADSTNHPLDGANWPSC